MNKEQDYYCINLMEVNKKHSVVTNQAIYNDQGILLLAEGAELNEKRAQILLQHKLMKPLEQCVGIEASLNGKDLHDLLNKFAGNIPGLKVVTENDEYQKALRQVCLFYEKYPLLQQNLTVLAMRAQTIYYQGIFSALAGLAIAIQLRLPLKDLQTTFIAGLFHDVGFLYLAPELSQKTQDFTNNEWKALQAHPLIAQRFLDLVPELTKDIGIAIAHHHERIDGTGYPRNLFGDKLSMVSQIIAATDNIIFNHARYHTYGVHAHRMLLTALKLSDNIYFESVYDAAMVLFKHAPNPSSKLNQIPSVEELLARQKMLREQFGHTKALSQQLVKSSQHPSVRSVTALMGRLAISIVRSGVLQPEQEEWLRKFASGTGNEDDLSLVEVSVMLDQIHDQLVHLKNLMERAIEALPANESTFRDHAEQILNQINFRNAALG